MMAARRKNRDFTAKDLVLTALMTAIVFLATFVPHIPIPLGYAHLGDAAIFLFALLTPRRSALFAACFGSALADFMSGFALWIVPTLVIKFVMAEIVCRMAQARSGLWRSRFRASGWRRPTRSQVLSFTTASRRRWPPSPGFSWKASSTAPWRSPPCRFCAGVFCARIEFYG